MRTDIKYISITGVLLLILLTACSEESGWENIVGTNKYLQIEGEIAGTDVVTKVTGDDLGTNIRFTEGDQIRFIKTNVQEAHKVVIRTAKHVIKNI